VLPNCYSIDAFKNAYGCSIFPCSEKSSWENVGGPEVQPPKYEKKVGRPPKARRRAAHEVQGPNGPRLSKHGVIIHCSHCAQAGHNSASCAKKRQANQLLRKPKGQLLLLQLSQTNNQVMKKILRYVHSHSHTFYMCKM